MVAAASSGSEKVELSVSSSGKSSSSLSTPVESWHAFKVWSKA